MIATQRPACFLSESITDRCGQRASGYDRDNRFFSDDFEELREARYLLLAVPREFGGHGFSLAQVCSEQRRLAYRAPATALATNIHLFWTGIAADLYRAGELRHIPQGARSTIGLLMLLLGLLSGGSLGVTPVAADNGTTSLESFETHWIPMRGSRSLLSPSRFSTTMTGVRGRSP
jgi:hypothetical protein